MHEFSSPQLEFKIPGFANPLRDWIAIFRGGFRQINCKAADFFWRQQFCAASCKCWFTKWSGEGTNIWRRSALSVWGLWLFQSYSGFQLKKKWHEIWNLNESTAKESKQAVLDLGRSYKGKSTAKQMVTVECTDQRGLEKGSTLITQTTNSIQLK